MADDVLRSRVGCVGDGDLLDGRYSGIGIRTDISVRASLGF